ncbi:hypothetical protein [Ferruginibacter sp. SUN106]|uniref:hypothetical protein n=1 Tax=Ferruginibacter sp. SUN106 TaxID=2978348 RepID=UPI003D363B68
MDDHKLKSIAQSKFKPYGIFAITMSVIFFIGICFYIYVLVSVVFFNGHILQRGTLSRFGAIIFIFINLLALVAIIKSWLLYALVVCIDKEEKVISFKNIFTRQMMLYKFSDFDGYIETLPNYRESDYNAVYLVKNKKAEKIISGFYYSNIDELKEALSSVRYLGFEKKFLKIARRAFLNMPIVNKLP